MLLRLIRCRSDKHCPGDLFLGNAGTTNGWSVRDHDLEETEP